MRWKWIFIPPLAILAMALFAFVGGEIVMHLWNWLLPPLFGWRQLTFWQALGLLACAGFSSAESAGTAPVAPTSVIA